MTRQAGALLVGLLLGSLAAFGQSTPPASQTPAPPQAPPRFRAGIELTQIDVSVLDANGRPVHGLKKEDFELLEDGIPQLIEACAEVTVPDAEAGAPWLHDVASDVRSNSAEDGRL